MKLSAREGDEEQDEEDAGESCGGAEEESSCYFIEAEVADGRIPCPRYVVRGEAKVVVSSGDDIAKDSQEEEEGCNGEAICKGTSSVHSDVPHEVH